MTRRALFAIAAPLAAADPTAELHRAIRSFIEEVSVRQNVARAMRWADPELEHHPMMKEARGCLRGPSGTFRSELEATLRLVAEKGFASWGKACDAAVLGESREGLTQAGVPWDSRWSRDGYITLRLTPQTLKHLCRSDPECLARFPIATDEDQAMVFIGHRVSTLTMLWRRSRQGWRFLVFALKCD